MPNNTKVDNKLYRPITEVGRNGEDREQQALIVFRGGLVPDSYSIGLLEQQETMLTIDDAFLVLDSYGDEQIIEAIMIGVPIREIAQEIRVKLTHFLSWLRADPSRESKWHQARKDYATLLQDAAIEVTRLVPKTATAGNWQDRRAKYLLKVAEQINPPDKAVTGSTIRLVMGFAKTINPNGSHAKANKPVIDAEVVSNVPVEIDVEDYEAF